MCSVKRRKAPKKRRRDAKGRYVARNARATGGPPFPFDLRDLIDKARAVALLTGDFRDEVRLRHLKSLHALYGKDPE